MTDNFLLNNGFHLVEVPTIRDSNIEAAFQKRYDDEHGKKYFITIKKWRPWRHPHTNELIPPSYEYEIQLYKRDDHSAIDVPFHNSWTLADVEGCLEKLWGTGLFDYYERYI